MHTIILPCHFSLLSLIIQRCTLVGDGGVSQQGHLILSVAHKGLVSFTNPAHMEASRKDATLVSSEHLSETKGIFCRWRESTPPGKGRDGR